MIALAGLMGGLDKARRLSIEELSLLLAEVEHQRTMQQLQESLGNLLSMPPPEVGDDERTVQARADYDDALYRANLAIVREDCCFALPLDHEFGERLDPPEVEHWFNAPGMTPEPLPRQEVQEL